MRYFFNMILLPTVRTRLLVTSRRNFLSSAFECRESWNNRLSDPLLCKVDSESMFYELSNVYNRTRNLNPIDIDIFVNIQTNDSFITEVEELVHKLRLTSETGNTLPTTHHAFIRLFAQYNKEDLMRILNDRLNYGIFPDHYCCVYLLNKFLTESDFRNAAKVAALRMFQEDFSHGLVKYMSLYAVLRYLESKEPWDSITAETETAENEDDEEEIKIRIPFLRNPFWDDHFDLTDGQQICGKTLLMIASTLENEMSNSLKIMGLVLFNKWDKLENTLNELIQKQQEHSAPLVYEEASRLTENILNSKLENSDKLNDMVNKLKQIVPLTGKSLIECVKQKLEEEVQVSEKDLIQLQEKRYKEWAVLREEKLQQFLEDMNKRKRLEEIKRKKEELQMKEELLYFFDKEDEIDLAIEKKSQQIWKRSFDADEKKQQEEHLPLEIRKKLNISTTAEIREERIR